MPTDRFDAARELSGGEPPPASRSPGLRPSLPERRNLASREQLLHRVRAEFEELRGLKLTLAQAQRLFGLREDVCQRVLSTLMREDLLRVEPGNVYARKDFLRT